MFSVKAYCTDHYNLPSIHKEFKSRKKMKEFCMEYLSKPNRKIIVHMTHKRFVFGSWRNRPREVVRKLGVFTSYTELMGVIR